MHDPISLAALKKLLIKGFPTVASWIGKIGEKKLKERLAAGEVREIIRDFLADAGGEAKLEYYLERLDAIEPKIREVHNAKEIVRRRPKRGLPLTAKKRAFAGGSRRPAKKKAKKRPIKKRKNSKKASRRGRSIRRSSRR